MKLDELETYLSALCRINKDGILLMMLRDREDDPFELDHYHDVNDIKKPPAQPPQQKQTRSSRGTLSGDYPASDIPLRRIIGK
jgi:hypothetical protein